MVPEHLKLLTDFLPDVPVVGIKLAQPALERVDIIELEFRSADHFDAFHDLYQPAACFVSFLAQEQRFPPLCEHELFRLNLSVANDEDLPEAGI